MTKEKIEIAHNLLDEGLDFDFIVRVTGLSLEEVKKIKTDIDNRA